MTYRYDPFGRTLASTGSLAMANTLRFSSKPIHNASGLYDYGYRWYSPNLQRWISRDPLQEFSGVNLYRFVGNAPTGIVDPFGLIGWGPPGGPGQCTPAGRCVPASPRRPLPASPLDQAKAWIRKCHPTLCDVGAVIVDAPLSVLPYGEALGSALDI